MNEKLKINAEKIINLLLTKYKAKEIDRIKFATLLTGDEAAAEWTNTELFEYDIDDEITNVKYFLINNAEVINENCKCISPKNEEVDYYSSVSVNPYILVGLGIRSDDILTDDYYIMSSFRHNIFDEMCKL